MKALDWIDTEEAMEMAKTEMMSKEVCTSICLSCYLTFTYIVFFYYN